MFFKSLNWIQHKENEIMILIQYFTAKIPIACQSNNNSLTKCNHAIVIYKFINVIYYYYYFVSSWVITIN